MNGKKTAEEIIRVWENSNCDHSDCEDCLLNTLCDRICNLRDKMQDMGEYAIFQGEKK